jgi:hypothetical protein
VARLFAQSVCDIYGRAQLLPDAKDAADLAKLSGRFADELGQLQSEFTELANVGTGESIALILRLTTAAPTMVTNRRSTRRVQVHG